MEEKPEYADWKAAYIPAKDETPPVGFRPLPRQYSEHYLKRNFPKKRTATTPTAEVDPHPAVVPISDARLKSYDKGAVKIHPESARTQFAKRKLEKKKKLYVERVEKTARAEILRSEDHGFLEPEDDEVSYHIRQKDIADAVDIASATKHFELDLNRFGPYRIDYTRNGRHLLIGGKRGHVAAFDWMTKKLHNETNVMEGVRDVQWLHVETMYAVAQKRWTYVYDNQGVELHCLKSLHDVKRLEFLPYHFLLVAGSNTSYLHYVDVSMGKEIASFPTKLGPLQVLAQNPHNAIIHCGHGNGTVTLWSPNVREPLVKMLAHPCAVRGISLDNTGTYMASTGLDHKLRIWDIRQFKQLYAYKLPGGLTNVAFSQRRAVACGVGNTVQVFRDAHIGNAKSPYLTYQCTGTVTDLRFCPYEDVLGVGHQNGFTSLLVPGSGEANFDALEANPYQSKRQRREYEVKALLDKIPADLISIDPTEIAHINTEKLETSLEERAKIVFLKPQKVSYTPRHKMKGRSSATKKENRKQGILEQRRRDFNDQRRQTERDLLGTTEAETKSNTKPTEESRPKTVLDRFKRKEG